jgi:hypothetical protein
MAPDPDPERTKRKLRELLVQQGRSARRAGFEVTSCPPFRLNEMAVDWRNGWRWEDESIKRRKK